ncbi:GntR family transcriptional regulator [Labedella endophytica]|uniref:GntR family transcriptional regulator n=1 Tax=Labedella endophytica TaxID=1523160 RepID=A0A433JPD1_9MICO|nr:GntR family transcriptional regulator [Labedella endophytica]
MPQSPEPIEATGPLSDEIYRRLGEAITSEVLAPGERIRDTEVASWLGVSRTPVREALWRLQQIGLVETSPSRYTRVTEVGDDIQEQTLEFTAYQAGIAMHMAVRRMDAHQLASALQLVDDMIEASEAREDEGLAAATRALYAYVGASTGNRIYELMMREAELGVERNLRGVRAVFVAATDRRALLDDLRAAIRDREATRAELLVRRLHDLP